MVSEKEFLEEAAKRFQTCPLCGSSEGFKVKGRFVKVLECNHCKSQWEAVTMLDSSRYKRAFTNEGEHYLKIFIWTKKGELGKYFGNFTRALDLESSKIVSIFNNTFINCPYGIRVTFFDDF
ncbi:MAG: hypothetical protein ACTSXW_01555 [Candidatus Baldrarchaeia archaeon]